MEFSRSINTVLAKQRKLQTDDGIFYSSSACTCTMNQTLKTGKQLQYYSTYLVPPPTEL